MKKETTGILVNVRNGALVCNKKNLQGLRCGKIHYHKRRMLRHQKHLHLDEEVWEEEEQDLTEPSELLVTPKKFVALEERS